jgi:hypothetical protein
MLGIHAVGSGTIPEMILANHGGGKQHGDYAHSVAIVGSQGKRTVSSVVSVCIFLVVSFVYIPHTDPHATMMSPQCFCSRE